MPRKPSKAKMIQYDVEGVIARKLHLSHIYDKECAILGANPEETTRVHAELQRDNTYYEGGVPRDPEQAKVFLETCNTLVQSPATDTARRIKRASAALTLMKLIADKEAAFPTHVVEYIDREFVARMDPLTDYVLFQDGQTAVWQQPFDHDSLGGCQVVDEKFFNGLLITPLAIERKTFIMPGTSPEDTTTFRVVGSGRSDRKAFWEILYEGAEDRIRVDKARLYELLLNNIAYNDPLGGVQSGR